MAATGTVSAYGEGIRLSGRVAAKGTAVLPPAARPWRLRVSGPTEVGPDARVRQDPQNLKRRPAVVAMLSLYRYPFASPFWTPDQKLPK